MAPLYVRSTDRTTMARAQSPPGSIPFGLPPADGPFVCAGVSLCMIVRNEERFLETCLRSIARHVEEICIVDTGSTDRTVDIAAAFGARIEHRIWCDDFAWARNEAIAMATKRWILMLDADEEFDTSSVDALRLVANAPAGITGLWVRCNNLSDDYKGTGVSSHALVRLFPSNKRLRYVSRVHEFISIDGLTTGIDARMSSISITHHGYLTAIVKSRNKSERNLRLVEAATAADPGEPFNWYNLGTTSLLSGNPEGAIKAFENMRAIVGEAQRGFVPNALSQLADLYTDRGDYDRAIAIARESLRKAPHFANAHFSLGRALIKAQRLSEGRAAFEAAIADAGHAARQFVVDDEVSAWKAHSEIGSSYGNEGDDVAALAWFDRALANRPKVVPVRMNRARALERMGRTIEAEAAFRELAHDEPGDAHSVDYINYLLRASSYSAALAAIETALTYVTPRFKASLLVTAARVAVHIGWGNPETYLLRAVEAHPGAADALDALEALYISRGDQAAAERLQTVELSAPMTLAADFARRASRYLTMGRLREAEEVILRGLELTPKDAALRYNLGAVYVQSGRQVEALDELERSGTEGDVGLRALFLRSIVLSELGRFGDAIEAVDRVIALKPAEVDSRLHRFRCADALGDETDAEATLRDALVLGDPRVAVELATWLLRKCRFADARSVADFALSR